MCFSAAASFAAATGIGLVGAFTIGKASGWREKPLASIPLVFAAQQAMEGGQWLSLEGVHLPVSSSLLANGYALLAFAIWPAYSSVAVTLVEQDRLRRLVMTGLATLGAFVALYGVIHISTHPYAACIVGHSISYSDGAPYPHVIFGAYLTGGLLPLMLSSHKAIRRFGAIVGAGLVVAWLFYFKARFSVWCFFGAMGSAAIYFHFSPIRRPVLKWKRI